MIANVKQTKLIPAAGYLRMSSDKQESSIDDQRRELIAYAAKHGYTIIAWYADEGISGWKSKERKGFQHLIADAADGTFEVILCWDQSRFSRFDPMEANYYWHTLRTHNVRIETIKEGKLDFDSLGGWLSASVMQHGKKEYVKSLAIDVARGQRAKRAKGLWMSKPPYGYRIGPEQKLVLGPPDEVELVRRVFALRLQGYGHRRIAMALNQDGIPARRSASWHITTIKFMLARRTYVGDSVSGVESRPQFASKGEVKVVKDTHPAIIDRADFDRVQTLKFGKRSRTGKIEGSPLGGLLVCGSCGHTMYDNRHKDHYVCGHYHSNGQCTHNTIKRPVALRIVTNKIRENVLYGTLEGLTEAIEKVLAKQVTSTPKVDAAALRKQMAGIDAKLSAAAERLMTVDASLVSTIEAKMLDLKEQRGALEARLQHNPKPKKPASAKAIAADMWKLDEVLRTGSPTVIRHALQQLIDRFEIQYGTVYSTGKRIYHKPISGTIRFTNADIQSGQYVPICTKVVKVSKAEFEELAIKRSLPSFGFGHGGAPIPAEQKVIAFVRQQLAKGIGRPAIAAELNRKGMLNRGEQWNRWTVKKIDTAAGKLEARAAAV